MQGNIILRAPVYSQSGYGAHSKDIAMSLWDSQKFNMSIVPTGWGGSSTSLEGMTLREKEAMDFMVNNRLHQNSPFIFVHVGIPNEFQKLGTLNVGITAGLEADKIRKEWVEGCNLMDLVIVPSSVIKETFINSGVTTRVEVVEEGVDISIFNNEKISLKKDILENVDTPINLLSIGQWLGGGVGEDRKGIGLLIDLFMKTFEHNKQVGLILKTYLNNNSSMDYTYLLDRLREIKRGRKYPTIHLIHGNLSNNELVSLYKHPKVAGFVSLTSGEGWGRGVAESISCDLPVLVTGWGGHMHYVDTQYVTTVDFSLKQVSRASLMTKFFTPDMVWAYPEEEDSKRKMKYMVDNHILNKKKAVEYGEKFRKMYSKEIVYKKLIVLFEELSHNLEIIQLKKNNQSILIDSM